MKPQSAVAVVVLSLASGVPIPMRAPLLVAGVAGQQTPKSEANPQDRPAIPLEFYGYTSTSGATARRAFLREGAQIFIAAEGDLIEDRYRVVAVEVDSVVVEDTSNAHRYTLPLAARRPNGDSATVKKAPSVARPGNPDNASPAVKISGPPAGGAVGDTVNQPPTTRQPNRRRAAPAPREE